MCHLQINNLLNLCNIKKQLSPMKQKSKYSASLTMHLLCNHPNKFFLPFSTKYNYFPHYLDIVIYTLVKLQKWLQQFQSFLNIFQYQLQIEMLRNLVLDQSQVEWFNWKIYYLDWYQEFLQGLSFDYLQISIFFDQSYSSFFHSKCL